MLAFVLMEYPTSRRDGKFEYSVALGRGTRSHESTEWDLDIEFQVTRERLQMDGLEFGSSCCRADPESQGC